MSRKRIFGSIVGLLAVAGLAVGGVQLVQGKEVSANFSATAPVNGSANAGTLVLQSKKAIAFANLVPGHAQSDNLVFENTGSVKGDVLSVGLPVTVNNWHVPAGQNPDWSQVKVYIPGYLGWTSVTALSDSVNLGALDVGAANERSIPVYLQIVPAKDLNPSLTDAQGDAKDNQFQGVSLAATATGKIRTN